VNNEIGLARLLDALAGPAWMADAACRGSSANVFFPERGESADRAKAICAACPVLSGCLDYAVDINQRQGIWGGCSFDQRRALRRKRAADPSGDMPATVAS
jgi:WhiB family transcriptional regulator, redox-sensing transcriptional regulator